MVISALIKRMRELGAPMEAIEVAIEAIEAEQTRDAERKAKRAAQKAKERSAKKPPAEDGDEGGESRATVARQDGDSRSPGSPKDITQTPSSDDKGGARDPHRMPAGFTLAEEDRQFARDLGWSDVEIADEEAGFVDYWSNPKLPGSKALKTNWSATWRNRIRDLSKRRGHGARPNGAQHSFRVVNGSNGHVQTARGSAAQFLRADIERELREASGEGERLRSLELLPQFGRG